MKTAYATKRDRSGNRYILIVDTFTREYSTTSARWYSKEDFIEVSKTDRRRILDTIIDAGYKELPYMVAEITADDNSGNTDPSEILELAERVYSVDPYTARNEGIDTAENMSAAMAENPFGIIRFLLDVIEDYKERR